MILVGDPGVGKTSLIQQYVHAKFKHSYQVTIGLDVSSKDVDLKSPNGMESARLSINDIGGQERFNTIRHLFYPGANLAMLVYDITRLKSLRNLETTWSQELAQYNPPTENSPGVVKILIGNKSDLEDLRSITHEEADKAAKSMGCSDHILVSAKENKNVDTAFTSLAQTFLEKAGIYKSRLE